jgi:hypothetical protein
MSKQLNNNNNNKNAKPNKQKNGNPKGQTQKVGSSKGKNLRAAARQESEEYVPGPRWNDTSSLSAAVTNYVCALVDPFEAEPCTVPNQPPLMTRPCKYWAKGTFSTSPVAGANDTGFVVMCPIDGMFNDGDFVFTNSNALAVPNVDLTTAGAQTPFFSNADYPFADFGATAKSGRVVACGLRVRNITPSFSKGGQCGGLAEPSHGSLSGFTLTGLDAYQESARHGGRDLNSWIELLWRPVASGDMDFSYAAVAPTAPDGFSLGFIVVAPAGSPQTYEFEAYLICELQGQLVTSKTFSIADSKGYDAVANTLVAAPKLHKPHVRDDKIPLAAHKAADHINKHMTSHDGRSRRPPPPRQEDKSFMSTALDLAPSFFNLIGSFL